MNRFYCYDWGTYKNSKPEPLIFEHSTKYCKGDGKCIKQIYFNTFIKDTNMMCLYNCEKIKCKNYILCNNSEPKWACDLNDGLCNNCNINYGKWKNGKIPTILNAYCPICMEEKESVQLKNCTHSLCVDCYKKCNMPIMIEPPKFPYDEINYKLYITNPYHMRWLNDTLICRYEKNLIKWNRNNMKYPSKNLMLCCMCRK